MNKACVHGLDSSNENDRKKEGTRKKRFSSVAGSAVHFLVSAQKADDQRAGPTGTVESIESNRIAHMPTAQAT